LQLATFAQGLAASFPLAAFFDLDCSFGAAWVVKRSDFSSLKTLKMASVSRESEFS
jgi:hypothetical protein